VALAAIRGDKKISELASQFGVHGNLVSQWKRRLLANVSRVFATIQKAEPSRK
jgi:transposase